MTTSERDMVRPLHGAESAAEGKREERFTSLQPTYEDSVSPSSEDEWPDDEWYEESQAS